MSSSSTRTFHAASLALTVVISTYHLKQYASGKSAESPEHDCLSPYEAAINVFVAWALVMQVVYFVIAFAADLVSSGNNDLLTLRDKVFTNIAFPSAAAYAAAVFSGCLSHIEEVPIVSNDISAHIQAAYKAREWIVAVLIAIELLCDFHARSPLSQDLSLQVAAGSAFFALLRFGPLPTASPDVLLHGTLAYVSVSLVLWFICRTVNGELWEGVATWEETSPESVEGSSAKHVGTSVVAAKPASPIAAATSSYTAQKQASPVFDLATKTKIATKAQTRGTSAVSEDSEEDAEVQHNPKTITPRKHITRKTSGSSSDPAEAAEERREPTPHPQRHAGRTPRGRAAAPPPPAAGPMKNAKIFSDEEANEDEREQEDHAIEEEQNQLPKNLRFESPGPKSDVRGLPTERLRRRGRVSYVF